MCLSQHYLVSSLEKLIGINPSASNTDKTLLMVSSGKRENCDFPYKNVSLSSKKYLIVSVSVRRFKVSLIKESRSKNV